MYIYVYNNSPKWLYHLYSHQQCVRVPFVPTPHQPLVSPVFFFFFASLYLCYSCVCEVGLICISLMANDVDHLSICLFWPSTYFFFEVSVQICCPFFIGLFIFLLLICKSSLCSPGRNPCQIHICISFWF